MSDKEKAVRKLRSILKVSGLSDCTGYSQEYIWRQFSRWNPMDSSFCNEIIQCLKKYFDLELHY